MRFPLRLVALSSLLILGCEARAQHEGGVAPDRLSAAGEACAKTADCAEALRCVDAICQSTERSDVGDYHLAAGQLALNTKDHDKAIKHLRAAEAEYKRQPSMPAEVHCLLGEALTHEQSDPLKGEEAAAKLHRCIKGLVPGSQSRRRALRAMATLGDAGFDPSHLAGTEVSDRYLTAAPSQPKAEKLTVTASASKKSSKKTFAQWMALLGSAEVKTAVVPCWLEHWNATKKDELTLTLPFRYSFRLDPDDEARDRGVLTVHKPVAPADAALAAAQTCLIAKLKPIGDEMARRGGEHSWNSRITLTIRP